jgi:hypothetical protein
MGGSISSRLWSDPPAKETGQALAVRLKCITIHLIMHPIAGLLGFHQPSLLKYSQVLRNRGLSQLEALDNRVYALRMFFQE